MAVAVVVAVGVEVVVGVGVVVEVVVVVAVVVVVVVTGGRVAVLKAMYRPSELAVMCGVTRRTMYSWLRKVGITPHRGYIFLSSLHEVWPDLYKSLEIIEKLDVVVKPSRHDHVGK
jgi:hypothetical protein